MSNPIENAQMRPSLDFIEQIFEQYTADKNSVSVQWQQYFASIECTQNLISIKDSQDTHHQHNHTIEMLIEAYRNHGHCQAKIDPLNSMSDRPNHIKIKNAYRANLNLDPHSTYINSVASLPDKASLAEILKTLEDIYCNSIGFDCEHVTDPEERTWLIDRFEKRLQSKISNDEQMSILHDVTAAEGLEKHLESKYPGVKRFSLEGGEALIPMLNQMLQIAGSASVKEVVIGMAHRGRLNVLVNTLGKEPSELFDEFEGKYNTQSISGDVKYHLGFSSNTSTPKGQLHTVLLFNPSHLEIVTPVVQGSVRARMDRRAANMMAIAIHGDAAFSGQGVVMEGMQMAHNPAFGIKGAVHIVINNQIGFTTSKDEESRSTSYCTDVAKAFAMPVFHVNGSDLEAVFHVAQLAVDYRMKFGQDVVIDLVCYRLRGHNETDDPSITQPLMYSKIKKTQSARSIYIEKLVKQGRIDQKEVDKMLDDYRQKLDHGEPVAPYLSSNPDRSNFVDWTPHLNQSWDQVADTSYTLKDLQSIATNISTIPQDIQANSRVRKVYQERAQMAQGNTPCNWGMAELLAYATLAKQGYAVRLVGQDSERGTFSHRHANVHDQSAGKSWQCFDDLDSEQSVKIYNSLLSEEAVLAFEYGYAATNPNTLVLWEAQFGDFANGAQVVIDQFITSGEHKWSRQCGLTMLLPHGYEGQGAEHSSARLERFLQLCAHQNIQVCNPTLPSQIFHLLRRQMIRPMRRPLIIMSPKSLLRHQQALSSIQELAKGEFLNIIDDTVEDVDKITKVVICSGKIFYSLLERRIEKNMQHIAILRLEQIYPFPVKDTMRYMGRYKNAKKVVWCQEEPINQGVWYSSKHHMSNILGRMPGEMELSFIGREMSASPASGYMSQHNKEQEKIINEAIA